MPPNRIRPKEPLAVTSALPEIVEADVEPVHRMDSSEIAQPTIFELARTTTSDVATDTIEPLPLVPAALVPTYEVLCRAGLSPQEAAGIAFTGVEADEAKTLLTRLLSAPTTLASFGPKTVAIAILTSATHVGLLGREVRATVDRFSELTIVRPDGILTRATTGAPIERAGDVHRDGDVWKAGALDLGAFYAESDGVLYPVTDDLHADRSHGPIFELSLDRMLYGRALDGAEKAGVGLIMSLGRAIEDPQKAAADFILAFGEIGNLIAASPEMLDHFANLPLGDQVEAAAELAVTILLAKSAGQAGTGLIRSGGEVAGLSLEISASIGRYALTLDLAAAATGTAGLTLLPLAALAPERLLSRALESRSGPSSSLPELNETTKASVKRVAKEIGKDVASAKAKEIQRLSARALKLIEQIDELRAAPGLTQSLRRQLRSARNALAKGMKPEEMIGAVRDRLNMPVRAPGDGYVYNHAQELREALESLSNLRKAIARDLGSVERGSESFKALSSLADDVGELRRKVSTVVEVER